MRITLYLNAPCTLYRVSVYSELGLKLNSRFKFLCQILFIVGKLSKFECEIQCCGESAVVTMPLHSAPTLYCTEYTCYHIPIAG